MNKQDTRREDVKAQRINEAEERINMNKYYNITEIIKDTAKVEAQLSRAELSKVKKWDAFLIYKYSRDVDDAALSIAARTWVELYIAERYEVDDWSTFVYILKEVYQRTRTELSDEVAEYLEEMMLEEIASGRTAEARMLIEEYNAEAAKTYKARSEAVAAEAEADEEAEEEYEEATVITLKEYHWWTKAHACWIYVNNKQYWVDVDQIWDDFEEEDADTVKDIQEEIIASYITEIVIPENNITNYELNNWTHWEIF